MIAMDHQTCKIAIWFSIEGDLRFLSHRDTMTLWQRALIRAQLPVEFSKGFNPHMKLSLPLPRSVGMSSLKELLVIDTTFPCDCQQYQQKLEETLPKGITICHIRIIPKGVSLLPNWARYEIHLRSDLDQTQLQEKIEAFKNKKEYIIHRPRRGRHPQRSINLPEYINWLELDNRHLRCQIKVEPQGTIRISELCEALDLKEVESILEIKRLAAGYPEELMETDID